MKFQILAFTLALSSHSAHGVDNQLDIGNRAIRSMSGCYLVDYSYLETESLQPEYVRDKRVYDVNKNKSVKEWIFTEELSPTRVRLQHILFASDLNGEFMQGSMLKHQAEDWEYNAAFLYDFVAPAHWEVKPLGTESNHWTRKITNLDDGLRYQCSAPWSENTAYPEWSCQNFAPIPGRETRDMARRDYNTLDRSTRILVYDKNWLERQENTKVIYSELNKKNLAKELGKNWYVRLPDSECSEAQKFSQSRKEFWSLLRQTWDEVLLGDETFVEILNPGQAPRFVKMGQVEDKYLTKNLADSEVRKAARDEILAVISAYREAQVSF